MTYLLDQIIHWIAGAGVSIAGDVAGFILDIIGWILLHLLVHPLMSYVIAPLLENTVFHPTTLTGSGTVAKMAGSFWRLSAGISVGLALFGGSWGVFTMMIGAVGERARDSRSYIEAVVVYLFVLMGGFLFMSTLLSIANVVTKELIQTSFAISAFTSNTVVGAGSGVAAGIASLLYPASLLVVAGFVVWSIAVWIMREVDVIFYVGLLPITAALMFVGNRQAFEWNWNEAVGAVLSQMAMAVMWWIAFSLMGGSFVPAAPTRNAAFGTEMLNVLLGIGALTLVTRAPSMLQNVTGHRTAGVAGMAMGVAAGALMSRGARTAMSMTPAGQATEMMVKGQQAKAKETVASWGSKEHRTVGERVAGSHTGKAVAGLAGKVGSAVGSTAPVRAGKAVLAGAKAKAGQIGAWASSEESGVLGDAVALAGGAAGGAARVAGAALDTGVRAARTAGSLAYQPRATIGRMATQALGGAGKGQYNVDTARLRAEREALGPEATANLHHMSVAELDQRIDTPKTEMYPRKELWSTGGSGSGGGSGDPSGGGNGGGPSGSGGVPGSGTRDPDELRARSVEEMLRHEPKAADPDMASLASSTPPPEDRTSGARAHDLPTPTEPRLAPGVERRRRQARQGQQGAQRQNPKEPPPERWD